jgi:transposase
MTRKGYPRDVSDEEWALEAPYLTLMTEDAPQREYSLRLEVVKLTTAKRGFVLLPRRRVVERSFGWMSCFRLLTHDYERLPETLAGLHYLAIVILALKNVAEVLALS